MTPLPLLLLACALCSCTSPRPEPGVYTYEVRSEIYSLDDSSIPVRYGPWQRGWLIVTPDDVTTVPDDKAPAPGEGLYGYRW